MEKTADTSDIGGFEYLFEASRFQDGVICGDEMFNFDASGKCEVYSLSKKSKTASFTLDKADIIVPHCNSVCFGRPDASGGYPPLYANIYNNRAKMPDRMEGVCCVYRLIKDKESFSSRLIQMIRVGFASSPGIWMSLPDKSDVRPYGNFVVDADSGRLYAFVMRDREKVTRFFAFDLPDPGSGVVDERYGVPVVTLGEDMILDMFDVPYSNYLQGACCRGGIIYSLEGFESAEVPPAIRIIDTAKRKQTVLIDLWGTGLRNEPEFIDISGGNLYYRDGRGKLFSHPLPL